MNSAEGWGGSRLIGAGLRFGCQGCGRCCTGSDGFVSVTGEEARAIAALLGLEGEDFLSGFTYLREGRITLLDKSNGDCWFLGPGGCEIYPARPYQCRSWPFWFSNLRSDVAWERAGRSCPGIGRGRLHDPEEIIRWMDGSPFLKNRGT